MFSKLDDRDIKMITILSTEGRISKSALARRVNLSAAPCWERLKRLERTGVVAGYRADVALDKIAPHIVVFMSAELERHRQGDFQLFEQAAHRFEEITDCWAVGGGFDYILRIVTGNVDSYQRFVDRLLEANLGLKRYFTYIVTKQVKRASAPPLELIRSFAKG